MFRMQYKITTSGFEVRTDIAVQRHCRAQGEAGHVAKVIGNLQSWKDDQAAIAFVPEGHLSPQQSLGWTLLTGDIVGGTSWRHKSTGQTHSEVVPQLR